jgi:hypothetical protein
MLATQLKGVLNFSVWQDAIAGGKKGDELENLADGMQTALDNYRSASKHVKVLCTEAKGKAKAKAKGKAAK